MCIHCFGTLCTYILIPTCICVVITSHKQLCSIRRLSLKIANGVMQRKLTVYCRFFKRYKYRAKEASISFGL